MRLALLLLFVGVAAANPSSCENTRFLTLPMTCAAGHNTALKQPLSAWHCRATRPPTSRLSVRSFVLPGARE